MDATVRCHRCATAFKVVVSEEDIDQNEVYTVPAGMKASCPWCGYEHRAGLEMPLEPDAVLP